MLSLDVKCLSAVIHAGLMQDTQEAGLIHNYTCVKTEFLRLALAFVFFGEVTLFLLWQQTSQLPAFKITRYDRNFVNSDDSSGFSTLFRSKPQEDKKHKPQTVKMSLLNFKLGLLVTVGERTHSSPHDSLIMMGKSSGITLFFCLFCF